jgi:hypothetical protein
MRPASLPRRRAVNDDQSLRRAVVKKTGTDQSSGTLIVLVDPGPASHPFRAPGASLWSSKTGHCGGRGGEKDRSAQARLQSTGMLKWAVEDVRLRGNDRRRSAPAAVVMQEVLQTDWCGCSCVRDEALSALLGGLA